MSFCKYRTMDKCKKDGRPCIYSEECFEPEEKKKVTNADKIRRMSDEELAKLISSGEWSAICPFCSYYGTGMCRYDDDGNDTGSKELCERGALEFLQSETK